MANWGCPQHGRKDYPCCRFAMPLAVLADACTNEWCDDGWVQLVPGGRKHPCQACRVRVAT